MSPSTPPRTRLPAWFKRDLAPGGASAATDRLLAERKLCTVCREAACPNRNQCFSQGVATFMLLGAGCTRNCRFCNVDHAADGPAAPAADEPERVADAVIELGLRFAVLTSVTRDDLADGGADHFASTVRAIRARNPDCLVEVLTPDFLGDRAALAAVLEARPDVFNHNLETVPRLYPAARPQADYERSLGVLAAAKELAPDRMTKSGIMVGLGETDAEVEALMTDLRANQVDIFTVGQYLQPSAAHLPVERFVHPDVFSGWEARGRELGFRAVAAGPYVRSSYFAAEVFAGAQA